MLSIHTIVGVKPPLIPSMLMESVLHMDSLTNIFGYLLHHFKSITLLGMHRVCVLVPTHVTPNVLQFLNLWHMTTSVIQAVKIAISPSSRMW